MFPVFSPHFPDVHRRLALALLNANQVNVGEWHSKPTNDHPLLVTRELEDVVLELNIPPHMDQLQGLIEPNLPWAEEHFNERVSGNPLNPPPSHKNWPWAHQQHQSVPGEKFSHTYPERYWPKFANGGQAYAPDHVLDTQKHRGIRYPYGDLEDVIILLRRNGNTRQAYLPVWFPEDTGATHGERVPCSLGYHFLIREGKLSCRYFLRSCDFVRHFNDDIYLTARLMQWMADQIPGCEVGRLYAWISSLHIMQGDVKALELRLRSEA